jgi:ribosomal protein S18 acetylase RimI-like enzyme
MRGPREQERSAGRDLDYSAFRIRSADQDDVTELASLDRSVFHDLAYPQFVLRQLFDVHRGYWLVVDHPAGLLGYSLGVPTSDRELGWLLGLAVRTEHWRQGYGRALTLASVDLLRANGVGSVRLTVEPGNAGAIALYREVGFTMSDLKFDYFGEGEHRILMSLGL